MLTLAVTITLIYASSMFYIYRFRGETRYASFIEYTRKGWPVFAPLNCFLYLQTKARARKAVMQAEQFEGLKVLKENWQTIRDEAVALSDAQVFEKARDPESVAYYDVGFRTFFKRGWSKFYLNWYGYTHESAKQMCPKTCEILTQVKGINGAMFSILPPGGELTRHLDPFACSFRYHLGLATPNDDSCFISVDGNTVSWRDGECFVFDETYVHFAQNNSDQKRIILMCDVERPMNIFGRAFNAVYKFLMRAMIVPNTEQDKTGFGSRTFMQVRRFLDYSKQLKRRDRKKYKLLKFIFNTLLLLVILGLIYLPVYLVQQFF